MSGVSKSFDKHFNLSSGVLDLIMKSWSEGAAKQYTPHLKRCFSFCSENGLESLNADVTSGVEFLTYYLKKHRCDYSSVSTAYSLLSSIILAFNGFTCGEQPLIKKLLRVIFKEK